MNTVDWLCKSFTQHSGDQIKPLISILTPTGDRPLGVSLLGHWINHQTIFEVLPDVWVEWIIVYDDEEERYSKLCGIQHDKLIASSTRLTYRKEYVGPKSMARNLLEACKQARGDYIFICEDDDYYAPDHLLHCLYKMNGVCKSYDAVGTIWQKYYNIYKQCFKTYKNIGSAMCATAFKRELLPTMEMALKWGFDKAHKGMDRKFWDTITIEQHRAVDIFDGHDVVGIKGLPGREGIGVGHYAPGFEYDDGFATLVDWVGEKAADIYIQINKGTHNYEELKWT